MGCLLRAGQVSWLRQLLWLSWLTRGYCGSFSLTTGTACVITDGGACVQSENYPSAYSNDDGSNGKECTISPGVGNTQAIRVIAFSTEQTQDYLSIEGTSYSGSFGPPDGIVPTIDLEWRLDANTASTGWRICLEDAHPGTWAEVTTNSTPVGRAASLIVTDGTNLYQYGGWAFDGVTHTYLSDFWTFASNTWTLLSPTGSNPPTLYDYAAVYDPVNNAVLVLGGFVDGGITRQGALYSYSIQTNVWSTPATTGSITAARDAAVAVYATSTQCVYFHGGESDGGFISDLDCYDVQAAHWTNLNAGSATPRSQHTAVLTSDEASMLVFGGWTTGSVVLGDLWSYSIQANTWTQLTSTNSGPTIRFTHSAVFVGCMLIHAGLTTGSAAVDFKPWCYHPTENRWSVDWSAGGTLPHGGTGSLYQHAFVLASPQLMYIFGGEVSGTRTNNMYSYVVSDQFTATTTSTTMTSTTTTSTTFLPFAVTSGPCTLTGSCVQSENYPSNYSVDDASDTKHCSIDVSSNNTQAIRVVSFQTEGCCDLLRIESRDFSGSVGPYNGIIPTSPITWSLDETIASSGWKICLEDVSSGAWSTESPATKPSPRANHVMVAYGSSLLVYGGLDAQNGAGDLYLDDTWKFENNNWQLMPAPSKVSGVTANLPGQRFDHMGVYDPIHHAMLVFGGKDASDVRSNSIWSYDIQADTWELLSPTGTTPDTLDGSTAVYTSITKCLLIFAGHNGAAYQNLLHCYNVQDNVWSSLSTASGIGARSQATAVLNSVETVMYIYGGHSGSADADIYSDLWAYDILADSWVELAPTTSGPGPRLSHAAAFVGEDCMVLWGGYCPSTHCAAPDHRAWCYSPQANAWTIDWSPDGTPDGNDKTIIESVFAKVNETTLYMMGGSLNNAKTLMTDDTFKFTVPAEFLVTSTTTTSVSATTTVSFTSTMQFPDTWMEYVPLAGPSPRGRSGHSAVWVEATKSMVIYAGAYREDGSGYINLADLWEYYAEVNYWVEPAVTGTMPDARRYHSAVLSSVDNCMLIFGGLDTPTSAATDLFRCYDVQAKSISGIGQTGTTPAARELHTAVMDATTSCMFIQGGKLIGGAESAELFCYNVVTQAWSTLSPLPVSVAWHTMVLSGDSLLVYGGTIPVETTSDRTFAYNISANTWEERTWHYTNNPPARWNHVAVWLPNNQCMLVWGSTAAADPEYVYCMPPNAYSWWWSTPGGASLPALSGNSWVINTEHNCVLQFGGESFNGGSTDDGRLWCYIIPEYTTTSTTTATFTVTVQIADTWTEYVPIGPIPEARYAHVAVFVDHLSKMVMFGGLGNSNTALADLWEYSVQANYWQQPTIAGSLPSARRWSSAVMSSTGNCMLMFGGCNGVDTWFNDVFCYDVEARTSSEITTSSPPTGRELHTAVMHASSGCMWVYGGIVGPTASVARTQELYCYDVVGNSWSQYANGLTPVAYHSAVLYGDVMLVYGGVVGTGAHAIADGGEITESFAFDLNANTWSHLSADSASAPPARWQHTSLWWEEESCAMVYGGRPPESPGNVYCYHPFGGGWSTAPATVSNISAPALHDHTAVLNTDSNCMLVFGGYDELSKLQNNLWCYSRWGPITTTTTTTATSTFTTTEQVQNTWVELFPIGSLPAARYMYSMVFHEGRGVVVVFGGITYSVGRELFGDLWMYSIQGNFWVAKKNLTGTSLTEPARFGHTAVLSSHDDCMLVFGGLVNNQTAADINAANQAAGNYASWLPSEYVVAELWCYNMSADSWHEKNPTNPPSARALSTAVMASDGCMYIFGGYLGPQSSPSDAYSIDDLHCYNVQTNAWTEISPTGSYPPPTYFHTAVLIGDCMYIYGGTNGTYTSRESTLTCYNVATNEYTRLAEGRTLYGHAAAYAPTPNCMLVWGGFEEPYAWDQPPDYDLHPWCYNYVENQWEERNANWSASQYPRNDLHAVYISQWDSQLFFGGRDMGASFNDLWVFRAGTTTTSTTSSSTVSTSTTVTYTATEQIESSWVELVPLGMTPPARAQHSAVFYKNNSGVLIMFGGDMTASGSSPTFLSDTWMYSLQGNFWVPKASLPASARAGHTAVLGTLGSEPCMMVFGGKDESGAFLDDFWGYLPALDNWTSLSFVNFPSARAWHAAVMSNDNRMYVMGGTADTPPAFDFNFFDATALAWSGQFFATGAVPESRFQHTAVLIGDCIYIYGGRYDSTTYAHMYCFNIQTSTLVTMSFYEPRAGHAASFTMQSDCILVFGGFSNVGSLIWSSSSSPLCYHYVDDTYEYLPVSSLTFPSARDGLTAVEVQQLNESLVLFFGGYDPNLQGYVNDLWIYKAFVRTTSTTTTATSSSTTSSTFTSTSSSSLTSSTSATMSTTLTTSSSATSSSTTASRTTSTSVTSTETSSTSTSTSQTRTSSTSTSVSVTTTRTLGTNATAAFEALGASQAAALADVLALAANSSEAVTKITFQEPDGTELLAAAIRTQDGTQEVVLALQTASVSIPAGDLGAASASLASLGEGSDLFNLLDNSLNGSGLVLSSPPLSIDLYDADGNPIQGDLPAPLKFNLTAGNASRDPGAACQFWDTELEEWSTRGVQTLMSGDGNVACSTWHLSLFAIIVNTIISTFACSNAAGIFSLEGLRSLQNVGWVLRIPAMLNWAMLSMGFYLIYKAWRQDARERKHLQMLQKAMDACEICRNHHAKERNAHWEEVKQNACGLCRLDFTRAITSSIVRKRTGVTLDTLDRVYKEGGKTVTHDLAKSALDNFLRSDCSAKLLFLYQMNCVFVHVLDPRMSSTCLQRTAALLARIYSGWAVSAVFFGSTALAPDQPDCEPPDTLLEMVVRSIVIAWVAAVVGSMPLALLIAMCQKVVVIPRPLRLTFFWTILSCYFLSCFMVVCIFIASVSPSDGQKWFISALTNVVQSIILAPFLIALFMMWWLQCRRLKDTAKLAVKKWATDGLQEVRLEKISLPDDTLKKILHTDEEVSVEVTCQVAGRPEIIYLEEVNGSYRSRKQFQLEPNQVLILSVYQKPLQRRASLLQQGSIGSVSSMQFEDGPSAKTRKLVASAFLEVGQLQDGGFSGAVPLYHNKRDLNVSMDAKMAPPIKRSEPDSSSDDSSDESQEPGSSPKSKKAVVVSMAPEVEEELLEVRPASSSEEDDDDDADVPKEMDRPIVLQCMEAAEEGGQAQTNQEEVNQSETMQASSEHPPLGMQMATVQMELPPPMEAPPAVERQQAPPAAPLSEQATLTLPSPIPQAASPRQLLSPVSQGPPSTRSRREELLGGATNPHLADVIKASENRFARSLPPANTQARS